jgi:hypothetical protein
MRTLLSHSEDLSPTIRSTDKFNPTEDAKAIRKAVKGWGKLICQHYHDVC